MIKIENIDVHGFEAAIRGMRNPKNSWDKIDSYYAILPPNAEPGMFTLPAFVLGPRDLNLAKTLANAGDDHGKFLRMITVSCDITAPVYFISELDTYKIGTVRNSCSLQHKGASRPYTIDDFSVSDEIKYILNPPPKEKKEHPLIYSEAGNDDFRVYTVGDRDYKVYRNGRVISCSYDCPHEKDNRVRHFEEKEVKPTQDPHGYYIINIGGRRFHERWMLHRLVAAVWMSEGNKPGYEINHIDGNKGNNSVQNLEWVTRSENEIHKHMFLGSGRDIHSDYLSWKYSSRYPMHIKYKIREEYKNGTTSTALAEKYGMSQAQAYDIATNRGCENHFLFEEAFAWERTIDKINLLREKYLDTGDYAYFIAMRELMPMGYNYRFTWQANYQVLKRIYYARRNHALPEWHTFCDWIKGLPYAKELMGIDNG